MGIEKKLISSLEKEFDLSKDKIEVITFGYRLFAYSVIGYMLIVVLSLALETLKPTLIAALTASSFRVFSGGVHASSQKKCVIIGAIIFNLLGLITTFFSGYISWVLLKWIAIIVFLVTLITFILYAPADTPGKPITTKVKVNKLKKLSIGLLITWSILMYFAFKGAINIDAQYILASTLGLAWQGVSLWPITYKWIIFK